MERYLQMYRTMRFKHCFYSGQYVIKPLKPKLCKFVMFSVILFTVSLRGVMLDTVMPKYVSASS